MATVEELIEEFACKEHLFKAFATEMEHLLERLLHNNGIAVHSIAHRVKSQKSLKGKLTREGKSYSELAQITDLVGLRIITYLSTDVDAVANVIRSEFQIDEKNSVDKRASKSPNLFGYASLHLICGLSAQRGALTEYRSFAGMKAEIQVRSILQHAWAEIEHDLGYKSPVSLPVALQRRFNRLAASLESADAEFAQVKREADRYVQQMTAYFEMGTLPDDPSVDLKINELLLEAYLTCNADYLRLNQQVLSIRGVTPSKRRFKKTPFVIQPLLDAYDLTTITRLHAELMARESEIMEFSQDLASTLDPEFRSSPLSPNDLAFGTLSIVLLCEKKPDMHAKNPNLAESGPALAEALLPLFVGCPKDVAGGVISRWIEKRDATRRKL